MPHLTLADVSPREIIGLFDPADASAQQRRDSLKRRFLIEAEGHHNALVDRIVEAYNSPRARNEILKFALKTLNIQKRVTNAVAAPIYRWTPARNSGVRGKTANKAWQDILREGGIQTRAKQWARYAFIGNLVYVLPIVRRFGGKPELRFEMILPHHSELIWTDQADVDPQKPSILVQKLGGGSVSDPLPPSQPHYRVVDADGWWVLDAGGNIIERLATWDHGEPPFVPFRLRMPPPWDFMDSHCGEKLAEVTMEVGRIQASMLWVRKEQQRKMLHLHVADPSMFSEGQSATPESAVETHGNAADAELKVLDYDTDPTHFINDIRFQTESALEDWGIPAGSVGVTSGSSGTSPENDVSQLRLAMNHSMISMVRDDQVEVVKECEAELRYKIALQLKAGKHPEAGRFDPDTVREKGSTEFPEMTFMDAPGARADVYKKQIELGLLTHAGALMLEHPGRYADEEEAHEQLMKNVERRNEVAKELAWHNTPADPSKDNDKAEEAMRSEKMGDEFQTKAQAFGSAGGRARSSRVDSRED